MSAVTVTYQELPPMASWVADGHHHHTVGVPDGSSLMHFTEPNRAQYRDAAHGPTAWNTFCVEGADIKCETIHSGAMDGTGTMDWMNGGHLGSPLTDLPPPSYHMPMYNSDASAAVSGPYAYDCAPGAVKKRYSHMRTSASPGGPTGLIQIGSATSNLNSNMAPEELCLVCGDKASGYHYNALTCEGCKGFFRRSITRKAMYYCKYGGHCDIDMYMRRKCQACRLRKCLDIGMRPELVIPEEQCRLKRESKNKMRTVNNNATNSNSSNSSSTPVANTDERKSNSPQQVTSTDSISPNPSMVGLTPEQRELINRLIRYQEQYEMPSDEEVAKLSAFRNEAQQAQQQQGHTHFQHLAELTILNVQLIVEFTKHLPGFLTLNKEDQLTLLKACSTEILMLKTAKRYDQKTDTIVLGNRTTSWAYTRDAYKQAGMGSATDAIFDFAKSMARLRVDAAEMALLTAISVFSERPGLTEPRKVEDIQEVYTSTLQAYIDAHRPKNRTVFARLLMKLTDLRTLGCEQADVLFSLKVNGNRLPISVGQEEEPASSTMPATLDQSVRSEPTADGGTVTQRVPNVRIKVEPLASGASSTNLTSLTRDDIGNSNGYECHSTLYAGQHDDLNNNHRYLQFLNPEESVHQAVSSSTFPDTMSKWN